MTVRRCWSRIRARHRTPGEPNQRPCAPLPWPARGRRGYQAKGTPRPGTARLVKAWPRLLLLVSLVVPAAHAAGLPDRPPVVITTDCGADMDDQWAIAHA